MDKYSCVHTNTLGENLTLAAVSPGVHPPAKLASQMLLAAKTVASATARLLSSVMQHDTQWDGCR